MRSERRALLESIVFHGLLVGAMIAMTGVLTPPPKKTIRLDFTMLEQPAELLPKTFETTPSPLPLPPQVVKEPTLEPFPVPRPEPKVTAKTSPKKLQPIERKTIPQIAAVEADPAPASQSDISDSAPAVADPPLVAAIPVAHTPPINPGEEYRHANFKAIRDSILDKLHYPVLARRRGWSGKVDVAFLIAPDGNVSDLRIEASSGFSVLDEQALNAVRSAAPFTPPRIAALLVMPVTFQLN